MWEFCPSFILGLQREVRASLRLEEDYDKDFEDLDSTSSKTFVTFFKREVHLFKISFKTYNLVNKK